MDFLIEKLYLYMTMADICFKKLSHEEKIDALTEIATIMNEEIKK